MSAAQQLIDRILAAQRPHGRTQLGATTYRDEPLLFTGSQMKNYLPDRYRKMRAIARTPEARFKSEAWLFHAQGRFMEDWEDDFPFAGSFERYYPTYRMMGDRQLRGYFSWRARVRRGMVEETSLSFAFVYLYELINGIGVASPEEGLRALAGFAGAYRAHAPEIERYARQWMRDYAALHNIDRALLAEAVDLSASEAVSVLAHEEGYGDTELFEALARMSSYNVERSWLYREHAPELQRAACTAYRMLARYYARHRKTALAEKLFGAYETRPCILFDAAVFDASEGFRDTEYRISATEALRCRNGRWEHEGFRRGASKNPELGALLKAVDACLREMLGGAPQLKEAPVAKYVRALVTEAADEALAWQRARTPPELAIDLSRLGEIRVAAHSTCEALLTDEERDEQGQGTPERGERETLPAAPPPNETVASVPSTPADTPLTAPELAYLRALLACDAHGALAARSQAGMSEEMLVDAVNEKLFDLVGDTVLEYTDGSPSLVPDYLDDVKGLLGL